MDLGCQRFLHEADFKWYSSFQLWKTQCAKLMTLGQCQKDAEKYWISFHEKALENISPYSNDLSIVGQQPFRRLRGCYTEGKFINVTVIQYICTIVHLVHVHASSNINNNIWLHKLLIKQSDALLGLTLGNWLMLDYGDFQMTRTSLRLLSTKRSVFGLLSFNGALTIRMLYSGDLIVTIVLS